jgi:hypothetical protein
MQAGIFKPGVARKEQLLKTPTGSGSEYICVKCLVAKTDDVWHPMA